MKATLNYVCRTVIFIVTLSPLALAAQPARFVDSARDMEKLPTNGSILFWSGDDQITGFRNIRNLSATRTITPAAETQALPESPEDFSSLRYQVDGQDYSLDQFMTHNHVAGLLVLKDGEIALERYGLGNNAESVWVSFSQTKSVVSLLIGAAIADGYIRGVNDPVTDYLPQLKGTSYEGVSIRNVLQMASGVAWNEDYTDPRSDVATSPNNVVELFRFMGAKERVAAPGEHFNYNTGETNLAGAILRAAIGNNLATYLTHKIWMPMGMEREAFWTTHGAGGGELGGCCISATLRDWGRLALFVLNDGVLPNGERVIPEGWLAESTTPSADSASYGYLWWLEGEGIFRASGIFGQGIYFDPSRKLAIVVQSAWPQAQSALYSAHRDALFRAIAR